MKNQKAINTLAVSFLTISLSGLSIGCQGRSTNDGTNTGLGVVADPQTESLESAMTMVAGQADDATGGTFALRTSSTDFKVARWTDALLGSKASAANCGRAFDQVCNNSNGTQSVSYTDCAVGARPFTLNGSVTLQYSNNSCSLATGENVLRTYDHTIAGPRGLNIQTTSATRPNYLGVQVGGGGRLTHTAATSWTIDILGKHKIGSFRSTSIFDVTVKTSAPIAISGAIARSGRTINSGGIEVSHNKAKFTAAYQVTSPLVYNSSCCHPVSGSLSATYSGSLTGAGTIVFNGCGTADLTKDGVTRTLSIGYCE